MTRATMAVPVNVIVAPREIAVAVEVAMPHPRLIVDRLHIRRRGRGLRRERLRCT
jgi:hypothetical protein